MRREEKKAVAERERRNKIIVEEDRFVHDSDLSGIPFSWKKYKTGLYVFRKGQTIGKVDPVISKCTASVTQDKLK